MRNESKIKNSTSEIFSVSKMRHQAISCIVFISNTFADNFVLERDVYNSDNDCKYAALAYTDLGGSVDFGTSPAGCCGKSGIKCLSVSGQITPPIIQIDWGNRQLNGSLFTTNFQKLPYLQYLSLSNNQLSGIIPDDTFSGMDSLKNLSLQSNHFSGQLPSILGGLSSLQTLLLDDNQLNGTMPLWMSKMINLQTLGLSNNQLTGSFKNPTTAPGFLNLKVACTLNNSGLCIDTIDFLPQLCSSLPSCQVTATTASTKASALPISTHIPIKDGSVVSEAGNFLSATHVLSLGIALILHFVFTLSV